MILPLGLILSDVVKYIGAIADSDRYGIACLTVAVEDPVASSSVILNFLVTCSNRPPFSAGKYPVYFCTAFMKLSSVVAPLFHSSRISSPVLSGGDDHTYICGRSLIQISLLKCYHVVAVTAVIGNDGGVSRLSGIIEQPVGDRMFTEDFLAHSRVLRRFLPQSALHRQPVPWHLPLPLRSQHRKAGYAVSCVVSANVVPSAAVSVDAVFLRDLPAR